MALPRPGVRLERIVVPLDLRAGSLETLRAARDLARVSGAELHLLHACRPASTWRRRARSPAAARRDLEALLRSADDGVRAELPCEQWVADGDPARATLALAAELHADLILLRAARAGLLPRRTVVSALHTASRCPVCVMPVGPVGAAACEDRLVVVPVPAEGPAGNLLALLRTLAGLPGTRLLLVHVSSPIYDRPTIDRALGSLRAVLASEVGASEVGASDAGRALPLAGFNLRQGDHRAELLAAAQEWQAAAIAVQAQGGEDLPASVVRGLVRGAPCPVWVAPV